MSDKSRSHRHGCCAAIAVCAAMCLQWLMRKTLRLTGSKLSSGKFVASKASCRALRANSVKRSSSSDNRATRCGALKTRGLRLARTLSPGKIALTPAPANAIKLSLE